jgi:DNA-binding transcriptional ArsR family regulator
MYGMDQLSQIFGCLADPTRRAILARLAQGSVSVGELAEPFAMSMPAVSKHLSVLERAGLIEREREGQWRRCVLKAAPLKNAHAWIGDYARFWEGALDRMEKYLEELQAGGKSDGKPGSKRKPKKTR